MGRSNKITREVNRDRPEPASPTLATQDSPVHVKMYKRDFGAEARAARARRDKT